MAFAVVALGPQGPTLVLGKDGSQLCHVFQCFVRCLALLSAAASRATLWSVDLTFAGVERVSGVAGGIPFLIPAISAKCCGAQT